MSTSRFIAGAMIGVVAGLLIAPEKGEDLREEIAENSKKWKQKLDSLMGKTGSELDNLKSMLGKEIEGLNDDVRNRIMTILDEAKESGKNMKQNAASEMN